VGLELCDLGFALGKVGFELRLRQLEFVDQYEQAVLNRLGYRDTSKQASDDFGAVFA
jgi:hypothetical protein